jgi:hypothetical protein
MRSGLNGEPRTPYVAGEALSSAKPQPSHDKHQNAMRSILPEGLFTEVRGNEFSEVQIQDPEYLSLSGWC